MTMMTAIKMGAACLGLVVALGGCRSFSPFVYYGGESCTISARNTPERLCNAKDTGRSEEWEADAKLRRQQALEECKGIKRDIRSGFHPGKDLYCD